MENLRLPPGPRRPAALQGAWRGYRPFRLVSDLGLGEAPAELIATAAETLTGLKRASRPMGLIRKALAPRGQSQFHALRRAAEPYLQSSLVRADPSASAPKSCVFARMAAARSARGNHLGTDDVRNEMRTVLVAMMAGSSCGLKHAFWWTLRTPGSNKPRQTRLDPSTIRGQSGVKPPGTHHFKRNGSNWLAFA